MHPKLGRPSGHWIYGDVAGRLLGFALRFDGEDGKQFRPLTCWRSLKTGRYEWRWEAWPTLRPLYGLDRLAERPAEPVLVCEGEKAADAAARLLPGLVAVSSPNGSKSAGKADWSPLRGRRVVIWPDADDAGAGYADAVVDLCRSVGAAEILRLIPPVGVSPGWDAADALAECWTAERAAAFIATAKPVDAKVVDLAAARAGRNKAKGGPAGDDDGAPKRRPRASEALLDLAGDAEFWCDEDGQSYATFRDGGAWQTHRIDSRRFARYVTTRAIIRDGLTPAANVLDELLRHFDGLAAISNVTKSPALRVASLGNRSYVDLADGAWRAIEIDAEGWRIVDRSPVPFVRKTSMRALPVPEEGFEIDVLRSFVRFATDDDFVLFCLWLVAALLPTGPYPILVFGGEQGVGKSVVTELARSLVDPNRVPLRMPPKDDESLFVAAQNSHLLAFDNLSAMPSWLSDALCVIATDGGWGARQKYSDADEIVMKACRPTIANGIATLTSRPDFGSRAITIRLERIPDEERRPLRTFWREWEKVRPRVLGTLLDAVSAGMRRIGSIPEEPTGRLADFEMFARAAEVGLGFKEGTFASAYKRNRDDLAAATYEADPLANAVRDLITAYPGGWTGTPTELLSALNARVSEGTQRQRNWPQTSISIGSQVDRIAPVLRSQGIAVERRHSGVRTISIAPIRRNPPNPDTTERG